LASSLTGFSRWLDLHGHGGKHLVSAVPFRRRYRLADVPCALAWEQVQRLLAAVGRRAINAGRNYTMLLLLTTCGLRGCEARALRPDSIDWSREEITVFSPKAGRSRKLRLTPQAGEAVIQYLREQRPASRLQGPQARPARSPSYRLIQPRRRLLRRSSGPEPSPHTAGEPGG
jgi:integrase